MTSVEIDSFKKHMIFNDKGALLSYNMDLLKKGAGNKFDSVMTNITREFGGNTDHIIIVDKFGNEKVIDNNPKFVNTNNEEFSIKELEKWEGIFFITSLTCPHCITKFNDMNSLSENEDYKDIKFVALFIQPSEVLENYKKGSAYSNFGLLNENWNSFFSAKEIIKTLIPEYSEKENGFPYAFYRKEGKTIKMIDSKESKDLEKIKEKLKLINRVE